MQCEASFASTPGIYRFDSLDNLVGRPQRTSERVTGDGECTCNQCTEQTLLPLLKRQSVLREETG